MPKIFVGQIINPKAIDRIDVLKLGICIVNDLGIIEVFNRTTQAEIEILRNEYDPEAEWVELGPNQFLIPGFVDTHTHAGLFGIRGAASQYENLLEWQTKAMLPREGWFKVGADESEDQYYKRVTDHYRAMVSHLVSCGTTTCAYVGTTQVEANVALLDILKELGQRAIIGKACSDDCDLDDYKERFEDAFNNTLLFVDAVGEVDANRGLLYAALTPNFVHSCSAELLRDLGTIAKDASLRIQVHFAASKGEMAAARQKLSRFNSYIDMFDQNELLTMKSILAHAIHLTTEDRNVLKHRGIGVAHCPGSDLALLNGICDVQALLGDGIKVGLGSDCSAGSDCSILEAIRRSIDASKVLAIMDPSKRTLAPAEAFFLATLGGAQVLNLADKVGNFEVGKSMDSLVIDVGADDTLVTILPEDDLITKFERFLFCGDDRNINSVYVQGKKLA